MISKLGAGRAEYYLEQVHAGAGEYYTADQAEPGHWTGKAAEILGLAGEVSPEASTGCSTPATPTAVSRSEFRSRRPKEWPASTCASVHLSRSRWLGAGAPELARAIVDAHDNAVDQAVGAMEAEALRARRAAGGREVVPTVGLVEAAAVGTKYG